MSMESFFDKVKSADYKQVADYVKEVITTKYVCFEGRVGIEAFWTYMLPVLILGIIPVIGQLWLLATLLPSLGISARRLHDTGKSEMLLLLCLIPVVGIVVVLYFCSLPGQADAHEYGSVNEK